jgi:hypothetical protein
METKSVAEQILTSQKEGLKNRREQSLEFGTKPLQDNIKAMSILY